MRSNCVERILALSKLVKNGLDFCAPFGGEGMSRRYLRHYSSHTVFVLSVVDTVGEFFRKLLACFSAFWKQWKPINNPRRILIVQSHPVGDTVMTTPAIRALRKKFSQSRLFVLAEPSAASILSNNPDVDEIIPFQRPHFRYDERSRLSPLKRLTKSVAYHIRYLSHLFDIAVKLRRFRFDLAIDFDSDPRRALLMVLAGIPVRVGIANGGGSFLLTHPVDISDDTLHEIQKRLKVVQAIGADSTPKPTVSWSEKDEQSLNEKLLRHGVKGGELLVALCPCAGFPSKEWRAENWSIVADTLITKHQATVLLCAATHERPKVEAIKNHMRYLPVDLCGELSLPELMALIGRCALVVTVDSGPMHIAATLGKPMVVLWSMQSLPSNFGPIYSDGEVSLVWKDVPCKNCRKFVCPLPVSCMDMITPDEVIAAVEEMLTRSKNLGVKG
jgi:lipopolysaccharide heptosyltransferase II